MTSSRVKKIRFHAMKIVLDQGLMRYLKKIIYDERKLFYRGKINDARNLIKKV